MDQELTVPAWTRWDGRAGRFMEAVIDVEARIPGSTQCVRIYLEATHSEAVSNRRTAAAKLLLDAEQVKFNRYGHGVSPMVVLL